MKVLIELKDEDSLNTYELDTDKKWRLDFDDQGTSCKIRVYDDGLTIERRNEEYEIYLNLRNECACLIKNEIGEVKIDSKVLAYNKNSDIVYMLYLVDEQEKEIKIEYIGV